MSWLDSMAVGGGGSAGGGSVGIAQGEIRIDTKSLAQARAVTIREAKLMGSSLRSIGDETEKGVRQAESSLSRLSKSMNGFQRTMSLALGAITAMGTAAAQSVKSLNARFRILSGSEAEATKKLADLRQLAEDLDQPFLETAEGATAIMPALKGTNASLTDTLMLVQRLAILDPVQGISGAAFAVREFINGEYLSLVRRLELDRGRLKKIRDESAGDVGKSIEGLSAYIDEMGMTNEALREMGATGANAFRVLRSEGTETLATFFEPFLNDVLIPMTRAFSELLTELRKTSPELKKFVGIAAGLAGLQGISNLPMIAAMPGAGAIGKVGTYGAAAYAGAQGGAYIARKTGMPGTEGKSQNEVLGQAFNTFKQALLGAFNTLVQIGGIMKAGGLVIQNAFGVVVAAIRLAASNVGNAFADVVDMLGGVVAAIARGIGDLLQQIDQIDLGEIKIGSGALSKTFDLGVISFGTAEAGQALKDFADGAENAGDALRTGDAAMQDYQDTMDRGIALSEDQKQALDDNIKSGRELVKSFGQTLGLFKEGASALEIMNNALETMRGVVRAVIEQVTAPEAPKYTVTDELLAGFAEYQQDLKDIEAQAHSESEDEVREYEERKAEIMRSFAESVQKMLEDEAIRYARALADAQRKERDIRTGLRDALAEASKNLAESISDLNEQYYRDQERSTKNHLRTMRDIARDGAEGMQRAAARLDAVGMWEAMRTMQRRLEDEKENYNDQEEERREKLAEAIADEKQHYAERVQLAKDNAAKQIAQLWEQFNREEQIRREDNARKLMQMQQANQAELAQLSTQHQDRLTAIQTQVSAEKTARDNAWIDEFNAAQDHVDAMVAVQKKGTEQLEKELKDWWDSLAHHVSTIAAASVSGGTYTPTPYATGGRLTRTGLFKGERDEEVLRPDVSNFLRRMMGGEISQTGLMAAVSGGGRSGSGGGGFTVGDVIVNFPAGGEAWSKEEAKSYVYDELVGIFRGLATA